MLRKEWIEPPRKSIPPFGPDTFQTEAALAGAALHPVSSAKVKINRQDKVFGLMPFLYQRWQSWARFCLAFP